MKKVIGFLAVFSLLLGVDLGAGSVRQRTTLDFEWRFHLGDVTNGQGVELDDSKWRELNLPHDWSIEGPFDLESPSGWRGGYLPGGIGWYRKRLEWDPSWEGKRVFLDFDGVYMNSDVWINEQFLGHRPYGYISFGYDLTPYLKRGRNTIAVRVDHSRMPSGRWYTGSGIYRHVWLTQTQPVHVERWGTFVTSPEVGPDRAVVKIETRLLNSSEEAVRASVEVLVKELNGKVVAKESSEKEVAPGETALFEQLCQVSNPRLWSPENPNLYVVETFVRDADTLLDRVETRAGIRTIEIDAQSGFRINGQPIKLKGVCNHHDGGPVGSAVPESVLLRRLKLLKEMGCNAIRTAHNPAAPEFYDLCDSLGFLVMDEAFDGWDQPKADFDYGLYFKEWWARDLEAFLKRDRNHPSVVIWSIGNEVPGYTDEMQKQLVDFLHRFDTSRPVTQARGYRGPFVDIAGFNGHGEMKGQLERFHDEFPEKVLVGTEMTHTLQTRGVYRTRTSYRLRDFPAPWEEGKKWSSLANDVFPIEDLSEEEVFPDENPAYQSSYDNAIVRIGVRDQWKRTRAFNFLIGTFRWTGFDYLGEATIRPARTANFGILDLCGFPKDHYYLYQSLWAEKPMVHMLPHWTHPGRKGVSIPVVVYTNCESAELWLNGKSLGEKRMGEDLQLVWHVPYEEGAIKAVAKRNGAPVAEKAFHSSGKPAAIRLNPDRYEMNANRRDVVHLEVEIVDKAGHMVPYASNEVRFEVEGPGVLIGVENGDILDFGPVKSNTRKAFKGKCLALVQATGKPGRIQVRATSPGMAESIASVETKPVAKGL